MCAQGMVQTIGAVCPETWENCACENRKAQPTKAIHSSTKLNTRKPQSNVAIDN